ncbi:MAG: hypothetical protein Q9187_003332, partial [Circinaria calcarea]
MDAKPQRPIRALRVHGDENIPAVAPGQKTLHSRNKSSPALSTMANAGGLKAAIKRSAFGEISNTVNANRPSRDDSVLPVKAGYEVNEKSIILQQEKKATALSRPAQRPMSVAGTKGLLNTVTNFSTMGAAKSVLTDSQQSILPTNTRKVLSKRNTTIFKDVSAIQPEKDVSDLIRPLSTKATVATVHRDPNSRQQQQQQQQQAPTEISEGPQPKLRRTQSSHVVKTEPHAKIAEPSNVPVALEESTTFRSDGVYIDDDGNVQLCEYTDETDRAETVPSLSETDNGVILPKEVIVASHEAQAGQLLDKQIETTEPEFARKHALPSVSEPEEYWDEEEYEEHYDDEGYVTARSCKSRSDNTTVLFPKVNVKVKKELAAAKILIESTRTQEEIEDEAWDTSMVAEYGDEIFQYMKELEIKMLPNAHYMDNQAEIQWSMRSVLMDWLVQVHHRFGLLPETLFLCVNYIDRFLSCKIVSLGKLQLVGATAIFVAAKYEEINCPSVQEIVYMVDGGYSVDEILKAERFMLSMLQFELGWPGPMSFLRRISKADDYDLETRTLAKYFLEITIMDERFVGSPPSYVSAGAHCLSRMMLKKGSWSPAH